MTKRSVIASALLVAAPTVTACGGWIDLDPAATGGASSAGSSGVAGTGGGAETPNSSFKILVLTTALDYRHDSIPDCQRMLSELGETPDDQLPVGAQPGSRFTTHVATDDLADFTAAGLKDYGMLFWCTPMGDVFSGNSRVEDSATAMAALRDYVEGGGAWGGVHSATDFEKKGKFPWYTETLVGGVLEDFDDDETPGTVQVVPAYAEHPVMRGVPPTWPVRDEWFRLNRDVGEQPGFQVLARLAEDDRPVVWIKELGPNNAGRMFYTIRGHAPSVYHEAEFRQLVLNGILWATRRFDP